MRPTLIFIGGPPGVGKTTVSRLLLSRLSNGAWLDGDDVWRMNPFVVNDSNKRMVERNILFVLRSFLENGFRYVLLTWVLHDQSIVDRLLKGLRDLEFEFRSFTLTCSDSELTSRLETDSSKRRDVRLALDRLCQSRELDTTGIDTTDRRVEEVVEEILAKISTDPDVAVPE